MPEQQVRDLVLEHRQRAVAVSRLVAQQVRDIAQRASTSDIDAWFRRVESDLLALIAAAFEALRRLTAAFLGEHAELQGVDLTPVLAEWDTDQVRESLRITGPVAFKQHMTASGGDVAAARTVMANRMAGSAQRLTMEGERRTVQDTIDESAEIVGWRRVSDGDPCAFCAMLISRGAVYKSGAAAGDVAFGGMPYHDNDGCTAVPLYEHEEEPPEVDDLYRQWQQATARTSGDESLRAWRRYWDEQRPTVDPEELIPDTPASSVTAPAGPTRQQVDINDLIAGSDATAEEHAQAERAAHDLFDGVYAGVGVQVTTYDPLGPIIAISGDLTDDASGRKIGEWARMYLHGDENELVAVHELLEIEDKAFRGQGFAQEFNDHLEANYRRSGVQEIQLLANIDVGGYAWARQGYDWADSDAADKIAARLEKYLLANDIADSPYPGRDRRAALDAGWEMLGRMRTQFGTTDYPTPYELSQIGRWDGASRDDLWLGKQVLLGSSWQAVKPL